MPSSIFSSEQGYRFLRRMLFTAIIGLCLIAGFNIVMDPYDNFRRVHIEGITHPKLKIGADGARVATGFDLARHDYTFLLLGTSRMKRGMPLGNVPWMDHDILNTGLASANIFEVVRAGLLSLDNPRLQCVLIGLDFNAFSEVGKIKGAYDMSPLSGDPLWLNQIKIALSATTLKQSVSTLSGNLRGKTISDIDRGIEPATYQPGQQRKMFEAMQNNWVKVYAQHVYDPERVAFMGALVEQYRQRGIGVAGMISPLHAWQEEIIWQVGKADDYRQWRQDLSAIFPDDVNVAARQGCFHAGMPALVDPAGFQAYATLPPPDPSQTTAHATFYETSHYNRHLGEDLLRLTQQMTLQTDDLTIGKSGRIGTHDHWQALLDRRTKWLSSADAEVALQHIQDSFERLGTLPTPPRFTITRNDLELVRSR